MAGVTGQVPAQRPELPVQYGAPAVPMAAGMAPGQAYGYGAAPAAAQPTSYTIPTVGFAGPARLGAAVSAAFTLIPCVLFAFVGAWAIHAARRMMDFWLTGIIPIPIPFAQVNLPMNFVDLLNMRPIYDLLIYWDNQLWLAFAILWLVPWLISIGAGAIFVLILAAIYNMLGSAGGGVSVTLQPRGSAAPPVAPPGNWQQPGWPPDRRG